MSFVDRTGQVWEGVNCQGWEGLHLVVRSEPSRNLCHSLAQHTLIKVDFGCLTYATEYYVWLETPMDHHSGIWRRIA